MYPRNWKVAGTGRQGQVLLIAVLLMMVILLTGILFVAIVTYNQHQSVRSADVNLTQGLAEAGIQWCDENLANSPLGADWRPPFKPVNIATYDSGDPTTWPVPPVMDTSANDYKTWGVDDLEDTEDDYYSDFERARNWHGLVDATTGEYIRRGFYRLPNVNSTATSLLGIPPEAGSIGGKGHILVRVTYDPDPPYETLDSDPYRQPDPMSGAIKIESIGVVDEDTPVYRYLVAYKPIGLTDYLFFVTDNNRSGRPATLGFNPRIDMDNNGWGAADWLQQSFYGPMRFNTTLQLAGDNYNATSAGAGTYITLTSAPTQATSEVPGMNSQGITGGYMRTDRIESPDGITEPGFSGAPVGTRTTTVRRRAVDGTITTAGQIVATSDGSVPYSTLGGLVLDGSRSSDAAGDPRYVERLAAPDIFGGSGKRANFYRALTRDSGPVVTLTGGATVNLGNYGFGRGIYVDNKADVQFVDRRGNHDIDALMDEWMQDFSQGQFSAENSGWNATYTMYTAPGVEMTLYSSEAAALEGGRLGATNAPPTNTTTVWWPNHIPGEPGIKLTRSDGTWLYYDSLNGRIANSGEYTLYLDYPQYPNQVVFAEGNVRVHGILPRRNVNPNNLRDYNLTVVSGGTIYIDGQILSPQDELGRNTGSGVAPAPGFGGPIPDEYNSKIALLARDSVCLNATRIVPQSTSGQVSAAPDDPFNPMYDEQHWELTPDVTGAIFSQWRFGEPLLAGNRVGLATVQSAGDPGPAAINMNVYNGATWSAYSFGATAGLNANKFYFLQPGLCSPPCPNVDTTLAPDWTQPYSAANPVLPWEITGSLGGSNAGSLKAAAITAADPALPGLGGGPTEYRIKTWKVYETNAAGEPVGSVHAKVNALIYAENGCWFVIPGRFFDERQSGNLARGFRRYNYDISVRGCITEAFHAEPEKVREWSDKWSYPAPGGGWLTLRYEYDESIRNTRDPRALRPTTLAGSIRYTDAASPTVLSFATPRGNMPVLPCLPVSDELIFYGEGQ